MVRPRAARAHPSLHAEPAARGDRAGQPADFMRFLFAWQHVDERRRLTGSTACARSSRCSTASSCRPARGSARCCRRGSIATTRRCSTCCASRARSAGRGCRRRRCLKLASVTPIALFLREHARCLARPAPRDGSVEPAVTDDARVVLGEAAEPRRVVLQRARGRRGARSKPAPAGDRAFWSLPDWRSPTDSPASGCSSPRRRDNCSSRIGAASFAGRWTAVRQDDPEPRDDAVEHQARTLLRRYGVVFRRLLTREPNAAPWRELTRVYRRLEARGEIRGGRFVSGMSGEQFALPEAVETLREVRRTPASGSLAVIRRRSAQPHRHRHRRRPRACRRPQPDGVS